MQKKGLKYGIVKCGDQARAQSAFPANLMKVETKTLGDGPTK